MPDSVTFRIPFPPSVNHYWSNRVAGSPHGKRWVQTFIGARGKAYRAAVIDAVQARFSEPLKPISFPVHCSIVAVMPDRRRRDLDNLLKASKDALTYAMVWKDDSLVDHLEIRRGHVQKPGWLEVTIQAMPGHLTE